MFHGMEFVELSKLLPSLMNPHPLSKTRKEPTNDGNYQKLTQIVLGLASLDYYTVIYH